MTEVFEQLNIHDLQYDLKQNMRVASIKKNATLTVKQALTEEKQKIDQRLAKFKSTGQAWEFPLDNKTDEVDYINPDTHAINNLALCEDKVKDDEVKLQAKLKVEKEKWMQEMSKKNKHNEMRIMFRKDIAKIEQFERDEQLFARQYTHLSLIHI